MTEEKPKAGHARIPAPIAWVQDHLLLGLLMAGSGVINARFLVYGLVPNINDPGSWGFINTVEIGALAAAGLGLGGLEVRISYKIGECLSRSQWGRVLFLAFGMFILAFIEFWASYSQRSQNIPLTPADSAVDGLLGLPNLSITSIAISIAIPFISVFWGFAADDPAPQPVEDPATVLARLENERLIAEHKAKMQAIRAKGLKAAFDGALGREEAPVHPVEQVALAEVNQEVKPGESPAIPAVEGLPENRWTPKQYRAYVLQEYGVPLGEEEAITIVRAVGKDERSSTVGRPFIATIGRLKQRAKRDYDRVKAPVKPQDIAAEAAALGDAMAE